MYCTSDDRAEKEEARNFDNKYMRACQVKIKKMEIVGMQKLKQTTGWLTIVRVVKKNKS